MNIKTLVAASVVALPFATVTAHADQHSARTEKAAGQTKSVSITGMKCANGCGNKVRAALKKVDGVKVNKVTKGGAELTVASTVSDKQIVEALKMVGFGAEVK